MNREIIIPNDKQHWLQLKLDDLSSTEVSALFGLSKYITKFELWHRKRDKILIQFEEAERVLWGSRLESAIAAGVAEEQGWKIRPMKEYVRLNGYRMSSSFDYCIQAEDGTDFAILEIKNVDGLIFKNEWLIGDDGELEATPGIEIQVQYQMLVSGLNVAYIAALVGGNKLHLIRRDRDDSICDKIVTQALLFWQSIDANQPPDPEFERDSEFISSLYNVAEPGTVLDAYNDEHLKALVMSYKQAGEQEKSSGERKQGIKAEILMRIGDIEKVKGDGWSISAGMIGPCHMEYERKGYRSFKVYQKKEKGE